MSSSMVYDNIILGAPPQLLSLDLYDDYSSGPGAMEQLPKLKRANGLPILDFSSLRSLTARVFDSSQEKDFENLLQLTPKLDHMQCQGVYSCYHIIMMLKVLISD